MGSGTLQHGHGSHQEVLLWLEPGMHHLPSEPFGDVLNGHRHEFVLFRLHPSRWRYQRVDRWMLPVLRPLLLRKLGLLALLPASQTLACRETPASGCAACRDCPAIVEVFGAWFMHGDLFFLARLFLTKRFSQTCFGSIKTYSKYSQTTRVRYSSFSILTDCPHTVRLFSNQRRENT